ncbi:hypothetical protein RBH29_09440 [Herbivorax sp. ANBcel31]|uniref:hypothetical protein n=1 Tax=Herbivorax sp. ANBcel31 TaxID=3069754 RepID=UPI0027B86520|nr:hypothetical protein [Herbivorax sp. ANBcel31]MDQ2086646.1 hypothetical protein [Herbivorax sp. ANBcel31]
MDEAKRELPDTQPLDLFVKRVLAKKVLTNLQQLFQEKYTNAENGEGTGEKAPLKLYIINRQNEEEVPVKCLRLCKRVIAEKYPQNTLICTSKSKVILRFQLVLLVEYEDNTFEVLTLPNDLSSFNQYNPEVTKAFVEDTVIDETGIPVIQRQNVETPYETLMINYADVNDYQSFTYTVTVPFSEFDNQLRPCELEDNTLQSCILLKNLNYDIDILEVSNVTVTDISGEEPEEITLSVSVVELSLFEDIIDKLGINQDVIVEGIPEFECE